MAEPKNKFLAVLINPDGMPEGTPQYFPTRAAAADGAKEMLRTADPGRSVYIFQAVARLDMAITYDLKLLTNGVR